MFDIARVFVRRTSATPTDDLVFVGGPPLFPVACRVVHVCCVFTWDRPEAHRLAREWQAAGYEVEVGGPAFNSPVGEFEPGLYLSRGNTITSRGCINSCPFCFVSKREGKIRTLTIQSGHEIRDNNLLACPDAHVKAVFAMLHGQKKAARFTGGLDARLAKPWHVAELAQLRTQCLFTAYDCTAEKEPVEQFIKNLRNAGLGQRQVCCYVLVGFNGDTITEAENRLRFVLECGGLPFAMYFRGAESNSEKPADWKNFVRRWTRPALILRKDPPND